MRNDYLQAAGRPGISIKPTVKEAFRAGLVLLDAASANISEAGHLFATIDESEWVALVADAPAPMRRTLSYVRAVGEGRMIPQLATAAGEVALRLRSLPVADQSRLWTAPVEMFAPGRVGRHAKYLRFATEMDGEEVKRAFVRDGSGWKLRDYDEQRAFEAERSAFQKEEKPHGVDRPGRWAVRNGRVIVAAVKASNGLTKRDLEMMLKDLEEEA